MIQTLPLKKLTSAAAQTASGLKNLLKPARRILMFSLADEAIAPQRNLSVSLEKGGLSVVFGSRFLSRVRVKGMKTYSFDASGYPQPAEVSSSLALAADQFGAANIPVTLSIPKRWTIMRTAEFPVTVKENLTAVIAYELDRLTPFSADDSYFDFSVLSETAGKIKVSIMAANAETVAPYVRSLKEKGFTVARITVNLASLGGLCCLTDKKNDTLFVEVDESGYEGALFRGGFITEAFAGDSAASDEIAAVDAVKSELDALAKGATSEGRRPPQVVALFREKSIAMKELFKARMDMPVRFMGETDLRVSLPGSPGKVPYAAVGSVMQSLGREAGTPNLLTKGTREQKKPPLAATVVLSVAILITGILYIFAPLRIEERRLQEIDRQLGPKKKEVVKVEALRKDVEGLQAEVSTITGFKSDTPLTLNILRELTSLLPKTTWLTRVRVNDGAVQIEGYSDSATGLLPKLETSPYFKKVEFASPTFRDARMNSDRFIIKMDIEGTNKPQEVTKTGPKEGHPKEGPKK